MKPKSSFSLRVILAVFLALFPMEQARAVDGVAVLTSCINAINDPLYTRATLPGLMGYADVATLEAAITGGSLAVWVASAPGLIPNSQNGNAKDLFCGDSNDNSVYQMDSGSGTRDFFFGGAGNDSVTSTMWFSTFYGGPGNDYAFDLQEQSFFYGGPGNDTVGTISTGAWASTFDQGIDVVEFSSFSIAGNLKTVPFRTVTTLTVVVSAASKLIFYESGKRIANCIKVSTTGSASTHTAACSWKPAKIGNISLSVLATPTGSGVAATYNLATPIFVSNRTNNRS